METNNQFNDKKQESAFEENAPSGRKTKSVSLTVKGLIIFVLILLMMIPVVFVSNLISERLDRQEEVKAEVSSKWAGRQTITGPILIVPYLDKAILDKNGKVSGYEKRNLYLLPEELNIDGTVSPHIRHRSIFNVTVYQSALNLKGHFVPVDLKALQIPRERLCLDEAHVFLGISDFRGLEEQIQIQWDDTKLEFSAGDMISGIRTNSLLAPVALTGEDLSRQHYFDLKINLKGSEELSFIPVGKTNNTRLVSPWEDPSFTGNFLPNEPADISQEGFTADWKILYLNRTYPQVWKGNTHPLGESEYGVALLQSADSYAKTQRSVKYAILFVALTFALFFFVEILQKHKIHPLQYTLVGIALCIFYVLLLSFSEYISFNPAYLIASLSTVLLISLYSKGAFGKWKIALLFGTVLAALYGSIFVLIQLQDRALLFGSVGLFLLLAVSMYYSRKIDWYGMQN